MIEEGYATEADTTTHDGELVWKSGAAIRHPDGPDSGRSRVLFQQVPEGKTVKNRLHLDIRTGADETDAEVARAGAPGRDRAAPRPARGRISWVTMTDPEGNEFCVS